eukprot:scaffold8514_cov74-Skeletonema_dohrnii-CCMP3373.AAC.9
MTTQVHPSIIQPSISSNLFDVNININIIQPSSPIHPCQPHQIDPSHHLSHQPSGRSFSHHIRHTRHLDIKHILTFRSIHHPHIQSHQSGQSINSIGQQRFHSIFWCQRDTHRTLIQSQLQSFIS